jgi:hypothetical protein
VNALGNLQVANDLNENFTSTYMKVGAFKIVNGQKVGGNVASYFCLPDGTVIHAIAGQVDAQKFRIESRWALDLRKSAQTHAANLATGKVDGEKFARYLANAHNKRYHTEHRDFGGDQNSIPKKMPLVATQTAKTHWLLASRPGARLQTIYPILWRDILNEQLSDLPVDKL